ncbi:single-stranded-DNA-specific exonuclease RecJ [Sphingomonas sp. 3-13AW]|uniref:single-stranded-DNA-specific exonuclease RecJ n=1 Tax=Sphingomonas sp. 3-13AW TaxID=3050450 RepID=UPI003BB6A147
MLDGLSVRERTYRLRAGEAKGAAIADVMEVRGLLDDAERFLNPRIDRDMPDPSILKDMNKAADRIADAVRHGEKIVVFGDYDVDGACATSIMGRWLRQVGGNFSIYIPDRMKEGYGPSSPVFKRIVDEGVDVILCVDCGTAAVDPIAEATEAGVDVVVVDHHKPPVGDLPPAIAIVNAHQADCTSGLTMLCAGALAFMLCVAVQRELRRRGFFEARPEPKLRDLMDAVALCTVADIVPLIGPSRLFVARGLDVIAKSPSVGMAALLKVSDCKDLNARALGFALGPRINAGGRLGGGTIDADGALGANLLLCDDPQEAERLAKKINEMNVERQAIQAGCVEEAVVQARRQVEEGCRAIVVCGKGWHPGVVGIVAGRLKEMFNRPAIVAGFDGKVYKGSGRSVPGFDLGDVVIEARNRGILASGGGHTMACGVGCLQERWDEFREFLEKRTIYKPEAIAIDLEIPGDRLNVDEIETLSQLQPVGMGMPDVEIAVSECTVSSVRTLSEGKHVKLTLKSGTKVVEALWWNALSDGYVEKLMDLSGRRVVAIGRPDVNEFRGSKTPQLILSDVIAA